MKTSQRIFEQAIVLIESDGTSALSMRNLATMVQVTPMALYRHYANRDALLKAVADYYFTDMATRWQTHTATTSYTETLLWIGLDLVDFSLAHPHLYQLMFIVPRSDARKLGAAAISDTSPTFSLVVASVQEGMAAGELHGNSAHHIALALAAQLHGLIALHQGGRLGMSDTNFRAFCYQTFVHAIDAYKTVTK